MARPLDFIPKHNQPFTLEQAMLLEIDILVAEISRLNNSIAHLERTQEELLQFMSDDPDGDEDGEIGRAKEENDQVISSQRERITLIKIALMNKIGEGGIKHYGLDTNTSPAPPAPATTTTSTSEPSQAGSTAVPPSAAATTTTSDSSQAPAAPSHPADPADSGLYL